MNECNIRNEKYEQIFNGSITEEKIIINILEENMKKHLKSPSAQAKQSLSHL